MGIGLTGIVITSQALTSSSKPVWPAVMLIATVASGMLVTGLWLCRRLWLANESRDTNSLIEAGTRSVGTRTFLTAGTAVIVALSSWIVWNPSAVRGLPLSMATLQTSMLGWMVYRLAAHCRHKGTEVRPANGADRDRHLFRAEFKRVRRELVALIACHFRVWIR